MDECANPDRPDWCFKWSAHLDGFKRPRGVSWMKEVLHHVLLLNPEFMYEYRSNSTPSLGWCLSCSMRSLKRAGMARLHLNGQRGSKSWRSFLSNYVSGEQPATGLPRSRNVATKANLEWTTREWNSRWRTQRKSVAILCPLIFWNVILSVTTKWWMNPNIGLATQNSF